MWKDQAGFRDVRGHKRSVFAAAVSGALMASAVVVAIGVHANAAFAQSAEDQEKQYNRDTMQQALQTRDRYNHYGLHFGSDKATLESASAPLLDDIATTLKNFPEWGLRIVGHTDSTGTKEGNAALSLQRAEAIKAALLERGIDASRLLTAGAGQDRPIATNETAEGRALNRHVELVRFTDSSEAKKILKSMSDYMGSQTVLSFAYDANLQIVTQDEQKLGLLSSGTVELSRPDKIHTTRSGGFVNVEVTFDGKKLTLVGKDINKYTQVDFTGSVDQLVDELKDKHGLPLPGADLLMTNSYDELMQGVYDSKDLGSGVINGTECDSLAFRKDEVDFQIWVAQGSQPYPCALAITSRNVAGGPQYSLVVRDWKAGDAAMVGNFSFQNSSNAEMVNVEDIKSKLSELPGNMVRGEK